ncbi:tonB dependent receptor family protein (plasmid) [Blastomonas sp. RAC04]|uniref:TonB-dependent receptor plug domain-containing protein n=1 Tax=Blastomonas sp. RAC04 TaxID=1842535 RepID=UPI0008554DF2|nr:TonB-dependent receptor [Blastomonas sp. RAC04]AOF98807.1 tonB dependent receptor family protein [Blastomonas sp. RAC04]
MFDYRRNGISFSVLAVSLCMATPAMAQDRNEPTGASQTLIAGSAEDQVIVVTGTRFGQRIAVDSPTPIDSISADELTSGGETELQNMLRIDVPSFNTARPVAAGVANFLRSPTLRGLSTGQTLVLVNGKRRHTNSDLNVGNQVGRGDVAYNFNALPIIALKRVEVLRDGASAQYGSDAVAGIINVILDDSIGGDVFATGGLTTRGDGEKFTVGAGYGFALGDGGFVRLSGQFQTQESTNRARPDTRQQYFGVSPTGAPVLPSGNFGSGIGLTPSNGSLDPREATIDRDNLFLFGQPEYDNYSFILNAALPVSEDAELFAFGGYSDLSGTNANFFRRAGQNETIRAIYPDGFNPFQTTTLIDYSGAVGLRGDDLAGFGWELSTKYGLSRTDLGFINSNNVSFGLGSPTEFGRGGTRFEQWTTNVDFTRAIEVGDGSPLNLAFGAEYRDETFRAVAGEPASYSFGGIPILDGPNAGQIAPAGAQPVPGTSPEEEVDAGRDTIAFYAELEKEFADRFLVSLAGRYEDYSDFGSTTDFRLASRFSVTDELNLRGSVGTSFRAPALAQQFFQRAEISFAGGVPTSTRIVSPNDPLAPLIGASPLTPEEATTISLGATYRRGGFSASVDVYKIDLDDRIVLSSQFGSPALTQLLEANGFGGIRAVTFVSNAVDTTTRGIDITARFQTALLGGDLTSTLAANFTDTDFDRIAGTPAALEALGITTELFDLRSQVRLAEGIPQSKVTLNFNWRSGPWEINVTNTRYGEVSQADLTNRTQAQVDALVTGFDTTLIARDNGNFDIVETFGAEIITDISVAYNLSTFLTLRVGVDNIFDVFPDEQVATTVEAVQARTSGSDNSGIFPYSYLAPFGVAGAYVYGSVGVRF